MSSILDALERASKERAARKGQPITSDSLGQQSVLERRLREENERNRIALRTSLGLVFLLLIVVVPVAVYMTNTRSSDVDVTAASAPVVAPDPAIEAAAAASLPTTAPAAEPQPSPTPPPSPTPWPSPTAWPSPTPVESRAAYIENTPDATTSYKGIFKDGQVIRPSEIGLEISGVMELSGGNVALINDKQMRAGQKIGELHLVDIQSGLITVDIGDGTIVKVRF